MPGERCPWPGNDPLMVEYHDKEWGVPLHDDRTLYEYLVLDAAQAGLSWRTVLYRREGYRQAFADYNLSVIAGYGPADLERLLGDPGIIRNRQKVTAAVGAARLVLEIQRETGSFASYIWGFTGGRTITNRWSSLSDLPATSPESEAMSRDLRKRGFGFVGPTICYAFMQAAGMINDHLVGCFRHAEVARERR